MEALETNAVENVAILEYSKGCLSFFLAVPISAGDLYFEGNLKPSDFPSLKHFKTVIHYPHILKVIVNNCIFKDTLENTLSINSK